MDRPTRLMAWWYKSDEWMGTIRLIFTTRSARIGAVLNLSLVSGQKGATGFLKGWVADPIGQPSMLLFMPMPKAHFYRKIV